MTAHVNQELAGQRTLWTPLPDDAIGHPQASAAPNPLSRRWSQRSQAERREHVTLRVTYRGTSEALYMVSARGAKGLFTGHDAIHDVMREVIMGEAYYREDSYLCSPALWTAHPRPLQ
uniref:Uncharacterized protein n=1 Tax=uncultured prokaryote TaxID=198431 RepID=A0A0H5Q8G0_9ZZZZ|nr:hypothetical protein [uncultured prokaryote]